SVERFPVPANEANADRRIRVGYISPDFRDHVIGRNLLPLFARHDRQSFEVVCFSETATPDALTGHFRKYADAWEDTGSRDDGQLAELVRSKRIDILVDLTQHMAGNRLPVFAKNPAPVQVSFAGYPESTGLETIGWRISDKWLEADASQSPECV